MKIQQQFRVLILSAIALITIISFNACSKDTPENIYTFSASLDGSEAMPPNSSSATGWCNVTYDSIANQLSYSISWKGLASDPSAVYFQAPVAGTSDYVNMPVSDLSTIDKGGVSGRIIIDQQYEAALLGYKFYVNVVNSSFPGGEIRGQLVKPHE